MSLLNGAEMHFIVAKPAVRVAAREANVRAFVFRSSRRGGCSEATKRRAEGMILMTLPP